jgi:PBP1b-binding outer membrane lipoprotein LpoB
MKNLFIVLFMAFIISGCIHSNQVTEKDCKKQGKIYKEKEVLNYRTGQKEIRAECI